MYDVPEVRGETTIDGGVEGSWGPKEERCWKTCDSAAVLDGVEALGDEGEEVGVVAPSLVLMLSHIVV